MSSVSRLDAMKTAIKQTHTDGVLDIGYGLRDPKVAKAQAAGQL